jgi:hypothetical protein
MARISIWNWLDEEESIYSAPAFESTTKAGDAYWPGDIALRCTRSRVSFLRDRARVRRVGGFQIVAVAGPNKSVHDYEWNSKAELAILSLHEKIDELREQNWA